MSLHNIYWPQEPPTTVATWLCTNNPAPSSPAGIGKLTGSFALLTQFYDRQVHQPLDAEALESSKRAIHLALAQHAQLYVFAYGQLLVMARTPREEYEWIELSSHRSGLQILLDDFSDVVSAITPEMIRILDDAILNSQSTSDGLAHESIIPCGIDINRHWWWRHGLSDESLAYRSAHLALEEVAEVKPEVFTFLLGDANSTTHKTTSELTDQDSIIERGIDTQQTVASPSERGGREMPSAVRDLMEQCARATTLEEWTAVCASRTTLQALLNSSEVVLDEDDLDLLDSRIRRLGKNYFRPTRPKVAPPQSEWWWDYPRLQWRTMTGAVELEYSSPCPVCDRTHHVLTRSRVSSEASASPLVVGSKIKLPELVAHADYVPSPRVHARAKTRGPWVILDDGIEIHGDFLYTEVVTTPSEIVSLRLVKVSHSAELDRYDFIAPLGHCDLWKQWSLKTLPDARLWNEDLATRDRFRKLRLEMHFAQVNSARTLAEAEQFMNFLRLVHTPLPELDAETGVWTWSCRTPTDDLRTMRFTIARPEEALYLGDGLSSLLPPEAFRARADELAEALVPYPQDLGSEDREVIEKALSVTIDALRQLREFFAGEDTTIGQWQFWSDPELRTAPLHTYERRYVDHQLRIWERDFANIKSAPLLTARSVEEADAFMRLHPCPNCTAATPRFASRLVALGEDLLTQYAGACPSCGNRRGFVFEIADDIREHSEVALSFGDGPSPLLDAGQWMALADQLAASVPADNVDDAGRARLRMATGAVDEVLKFISEESDSVEPEALFSRPGWLVYVKEPARFRRARVQAVRDAYVKLISEPG